MSKCPNKTLDDFSRLVDTFGEQGAYSIFMRNDGKVPYIQSREQNYYSWEVENALGLTTWDRKDSKNVKSYKSFTPEEANSLVEQINNDYVGDFTVYTIRPEDGDTKTLSVKVKGYPLSVASIKKAYPRLSLEEAIPKYKAYKDTTIEESNGLATLIPLDKPSFKLYDNRDGERKINKEYEGKFKDLKQALLTNMSFVEEVLEDRSIKAAAQLLPGGKTILVNPQYITESTLGHEFAHVLIDLRGGVSDPFIQQGIEQVKGTELWSKMASKYPNMEEVQLGKEVLAEAIGKEVAKIFHQEENGNKFANWLLRLYTWLRARTGIEKNNARELANIMLNKPIDINKLPGTAADFIQEQAITIDTSKPITIKEGLEAIGKEFTAPSGEDNDHYTYKTSDTLLKYLRISKYNQEIGFGIDSESDALLKGQTLGTTIHAVFEAYIKKDLSLITPEIRKEISPGAIKQIKEIVDEIIEEGDLTSSELIIADHDARLAGTIDLLVIKPDGTVKIYDFKTKSMYGEGTDEFGEGYTYKKGFRYYKRPFDETDPESKSDQQRNQMQLSFYKRMLKNLGVAVESINIVPIVYDTYTREGFENVIKEVELDKYTFEGRPFSIHPHKSTEVFYKGKVSEVTTIKKREAEAIEKGESYDITEEELEELTEERKALAAVTKLRDKFYAIREEALNTVTARLSRNERMGITVTNQELNRLVEILTDPGIEDKIAIITFVDNAVTAIDNVYNEYTDKMKLYEENVTDAITPEDLLKWYTISSAHNLLDEVSIDLIKGVYTGVEGLDDLTIETLKSALTDVKEKKNELLGLHRGLGADILNESLYKYSRATIIKIKDEQREIAIEKYADDFKNGTLTRAQYTKAVNDFATNYIKNNADMIAEISKDSLKSEMYEASAADINILERLFGTILDTKDPLTGTMMRKFATVDQIIRDKTLKNRNKTIALLEKLEKQLGYTMAMAPSKFYDFLLEENKKGKKTGNIVTHISSELMEAYYQYRDAKFREAEDEQIKYSEAYEAIDKWKAANMPEDTIAKAEAFETFAKALMITGELTNKEYLTYKINESKTSRQKRSVINLPIREKALQKLEDWQQANRLTFVKPKPQWISKKWEALQEILKNKDDAKTEFYNHIVDMSAQADKMLRQNSRINNRLPFMRKQGREIQLEGGTLKDRMSESFKDSFTFRYDETAYGTAFLDETGKPIDMVPINYVRKNDSKELKKSRKELNNKLSNKEITQEEYDKEMKSLVPYNIEEQSFDVASLYTNFYAMAVNYGHKQDIMAELEYAKIIMANRKTPVGGKAVQLLNDNKLSRKITTVGSTQLEAMFSSFLTTDLYGKTKEVEEFTVGGKTIRFSKVADAIGKYTALNLLATNVHQAFANVTLGESVQVLEAYSGEHYTMKDMKKASGFYWRNIPEMLGDVGERSPKNVINMLNEKWDILNEYDEGEWRQNSKMSRLFKTSTLFFTAHAGEHLMQTRVMLAMLSKIKAYDKDGNDLGSIMDNYYSVGNSLEFNKKVDLEKSNWTAEEQNIFGAKVKRLLGHMHGEYGYLGKSEVQRYAIGRLALMFRKFVVPGFLRRYSSKRANFFLEENVEGYYRTATKFLVRSVKEMKGLQFALLTENYNKLLPREQANIKRVIGEMSFLLGFTLLASAVFALAGELDDDDKVALLAAQNAGYIFNRVSKEYMFFYSWPAMYEILRSPAASLSVLGNLGDLLWGLTPFTGFEGLERYERGNWKGELKMSKSIMRLTPVLKQIYKVTDIDDVLKALKIQTGKDKK